jgi:hypothetical protein
MQREYDSGHVLPNNRMDAHLPLGVEGGVAGDDDVTSGIQALTGHAVQPDQLFAHKLRQGAALQAVPIDDLRCQSLIRR